MLNDPKFQNALKSICHAALTNPTHGLGGEHVFDLVLVVKSVIKQATQAEAQRNETPHETHDL